MATAARCPAHRAGHQRGSPLLGRWVEAAVIFDYQRRLSTGLFDRSDDVNDDEFDVIVRAELDHYPTAETWRFNRRGDVRTDFRTFDPWEVRLLGRQQIRA